MVDFLSDYDYLSSVVRILEDDNDFREKVDKILIEFPMSKIIDELADNETIVIVSMPSISHIGEWGSATSHIQRSRGIVQIDVISRKGNNTKYAREIANYIVDLLYLGTYKTLDSFEYQIYNEKVDIDFVEYNTDYDAWHIVISDYVEFFRIAP